MRYGLEIRQQVDAVGRPTPRVFRHDLPDRRLADTALHDVYAFLRDLEPARTPHPGVFAYRDPLRGSGTIAVLGLGTHDLDRLQERVAHHEFDARSA